MGNLIPTQVADHAGCVFCSIAAGTSPATVVREWPDIIAIRPLGPVTEGHVLVIPRQHVADAGENPAISAQVMAAASELLAELPDGNIVTSKGDAATQTVFHAHFHVLPRVVGDGLSLPWTRQRSLWSRLTRGVKATWTHMRRE